MMWEIVPKKQELFDPQTGELVDLKDLDTDELAARRAQATEFIARLRNEFIAAVDQELLDRMDHKAKWTLHTPHWDIRGASPALTTEWDILSLRHTLIELRDEGIIDDEALDNALDIRTTYKGRTSGLNAIKKLSPQVAQRIEACGHEVQKPRRVSVMAKAVK